MNRISQYAIVQTHDIGDNVQIAEFAVIRSDVTIGNDVVIHPHVVIEPGVVIGDGVEVFPGAYLGKEPKGAGALSRPLSFERSLVIGPKTSIGPHVVVYYDVRIGESCLIGDGASIREKCEVGNHTVVGRYVTVNYNTTIGDRVKIMDHSWLAGNMKIGNRVFISGGVMTSNDNAIGRIGYEEERVQGPTMMDGVAIGVGAIVLPAVVIGENAVVGAGAVVTKDVERNTLVMGIPARFVKKFGG